MTVLAAPSTNEIQNTIAVGNSYERGTDTTITLTDGSAFPNAAHVARIRNLDNTKWCLIIYTSRAGNVLTMGGGAADYALAKCVTTGDEAYEWPAGSIVELMSAADEIAQLFSEDGTWTKNRDAAGYDVADLGVLNFDDATELTIAVAETERLASEVAWTQVDANCTVTADADDPDAGAENSAKMAMAAGAAVGLQAYEDLGAGADLTGSSRIRVWIRVLTDDIIKGDFQLVIDNNAACASPIQYCDLPAQTMAANWVEVDIPYDPTLANMNNVNSFGLYMRIDKTCEILIHELRTLVGSITVVQSYHKIDTEGGSAAETVLDTINGGVAGDILYLRAENGARTVILKADTDNIIVGDYWLDNAEKVAYLLYDGTNWRLLALESMITNAKARVYLNSDQDDIADNTPTKVLLDVANYDPSSMFANNKITIQIAGYYLMVAAIGYRPDSVIADKVYYVRVYKNGVREIEGADHAALATTIALKFPDVLHFDVGDYLELYAWHMAGVGTVDVIGLTFHTFLMVHLLSAD